MQTLHPKVKVPALVGQVVSVVLAVLAVVGQSVPAAVPITTEATSILLLIAGYLTYA
jgi:hypothetical protein